MKKFSSKYLVLQTLLFTAALAILLASCEKDNGKVVFQNRSVTNSTYNVVWDGSVIASIYPFSNSDTFTVAAGSHSLEFMIANTGQIGCSPSDPVVNQGYVYTFTCSQ